MSPLAVAAVPEGRLVLQTMRSHDQFNTTIYGLDDRYRGIHHGRRVVFVGAADLAELGFADGDLVDLVSEWTDGVERRAERVPARRVLDAEGLRGRVLPGDEPAHPAGVDGASSATPRRRSGSWCGWSRPADPTPHTARARSHTF